MVNGLEVIAPTSLAYSGSSATINSDNSVSFSGVTSLSLNNVFSSTYNNYMIVYKFKNDTSSDVNWYRMRKNNSDATTNDYFTEYFATNGTSGIASGYRRTMAILGDAYVGSESGIVQYIMAPYSNSFTSSRCEASVNGATNRIYDQQMWHEIHSTMYDGITIYPNGGSLTGKLTVFGFVQ